MKKGFAFTVFEDERDAEDAVKALSGRRLKGERVKLEFAKGERRGSDRDRYEAGAGNRVVVENLSSKTAWQDLKESVATNIIELETLIRKKIGVLGTIYSCVKKDLTSSWGWKTSIDLTVFFPFVYIPIKCGKIYLIRSIISWRGEGAVSGYILSLFFLCLEISSSR